MSKIELHIKPEQKPIVLVKLDVNAMTVKPFKKA